MRNFVAHTPWAQAMRLHGYLVAFVLAVLLGSTTPVGTGAGVHEFDLLHPLFEHVHLVNGRILTHEQMSRESPLQPVRGVALGSGGGSGDDGGLGVSPTIPLQSSLVVPVTGGVGEVLEPLAPRGREDPPPDPPPL